MSEELQGAPRVFICELPNKKLETRLYAGPNMTYQHYGLIVADLIRHIGRAFRVSEDDVFEWVKKEMNKPTTQIESMHRPDLAQRAEVGASQETMRPALEQIIRRIDELETDDHKPVPFEEVRGLQETAQQALQRLHGPHG